MHYIRWYLCDQVNIQNYSLVMFSYLRTRSSPFSDREQVPEIFERNAHVSKLCKCGILVFVFVHYYFGLLKKIIRLNKRLQYC